MPTDADCETAPPTKPSKLRAWLELLRVPNLFTVPGDPIVGFLLASTASSKFLSLTAVIPAVVAALCLYCAGLVSNDLFDLAEDRRDRPERPLPSGRISIPAARLATVLLFIAGIVAAFLAGERTGLLACALAALILVYNGGFKRVRLVGPLTMGLCRGFSLLLGASVFASGPTTPVVLAAAGGLTLYILSVTLIAAKETSGKPAGRIAWLSCLVCMVWFACLATMAPIQETGTPVLTMVLPIVATIWVGRWCMVLAKETQPVVVSMGVGRLIQGLLLIQASLCSIVMWPGLWVAAACVAALPAAVILGRRFYAS